MKNILKQNKYITEKLNHFFFDKRKTYSLKCPKFKIKI